jgi:hypothetical protein
MELPAPTIDDLAHDFSSEIVRFRGYWEHFTDRVTKYRSPRTGKMIRRHEAPVYDPAKLKAYLLFLEQQLDRPDLQFRCLLREVFEASYEQRELYRDFINTQSRSLAEFQSIHSLDWKLHRHQRLSSILRIERDKGAETIDECWMKLSEAQPCILILEVMIVHPTLRQHSGLRLFCGECHALDNGQDHIVKVLQDYMNGLCDRNVLVTLGTTLVNELHNWSSMIATGGMDHDGYYDCERWRMPMIEVCDPEISWKDLCALALLFVSRIGDTGHLSSMLRRSVSLSAN